MDVQDITVPYEILLRFDADATLRGAHMIGRRIVTIDGEVVKDEPGDAIPLDVGQEGTLWGCLDQAQVIALATATALQEQLSQVTAERDDLQEQLAVAQEQARALTDQSLAPK
jgi:hypothetical protein